MKKTTKRRVPIAEVATTKVFPFIVAYQKKNHGVSPSLGEVATEFGRSREWVRYCYKELVKQNLIRVDYYKQRGVLVIGK